MAETSCPPSDNGRAERVDVRTGLPLPDPFPEYVRCAQCGEPEVEVWCYQGRVRCHNCGAWCEHTPMACRGSAPVCRAYLEREAQVGDGS